MKIRALKTTTGLPRGSVGDVDEGVGKELIALGYAIEVLPLEKQEAASLVADNDNDPFVVAHQNGSQTGADAQQSSLPADQVQKTLTCPPSEDEETQTDDKLESSSSTMDSGSPRGQTHSMPATTTGGKRGRGRSRSKG